jgi:thermostable 8-oxoguanine DNA glycosylase
LDKLKTLASADFKILSSDREFKYQPELTDKLDILSEDFTPEIINQIILWKLNRYAHITNECIRKINSIDASSIEIDTDLTKEVLRALLCIKGVRLPMASTILRFRNPNLYQIIDQRVYRIINGKNFPLSSAKSAKQVDEQIELYLKYLQDLKSVCAKYDIEFSNADRILYMADKRVNKSHKIIGW